MGVIYKYGVPYSGVPTFSAGDNVSITTASENYVVTVSATNTAVATGSETFVKSQDFTWNSGSQPTVSYSNGILIFSDGTLPSLSWSSASAVTGVST